MFTSDIFHAQISNNKCEDGGFYGVTLEGGFMSDGIISVVLGNMFDKIVVCNVVSLIDTLYGLVNCNVNLYFVIKLAKSLL